jgi:hypothetical protein
MTIETRIDGLTYRSLRNPSDLEKLDQLFSESYPGEDSKGVFGRFAHWIDSSPSGPGVQLVVCDGEKIVGSLNFLRQTIIGFDETHSGFLASTAMTTPEYRGKGIYKNLTRLAFKELPEHGGDFIFGYTVQEPVLSTEMKLGYTLIGDSAVLAFPLSPGKLLKNIPYLNSAGAWINGIGKWASSAYLRLRSSTKESDVSILLQDVTEFPKEIDSISELKRQLTQYEVLKDSIQLNWKYREFFRAGKKHHFVIAKNGDQVVGWGACGLMDMKGLKGLAILDASAIPDFEEETITAIVKHQILLAIEMDLEIIGCMVDKNSRLFRILRDLGFFPTSHRFKTIFFPLVDNLPGHLAETRNWRHTWGSSDTL